MAEYKKKLIEVALPLEAINRASAREKSIRHGHPSTLHLWWARRPLAACRAVLFASLVDDPSAHPDKFPTEEDQELERQRLFRIIEELVKWENTNNEQVLETARHEILKSTDGNPPPILDPFCGGGSIPLEAQRLGLKVYASDLNPVAVLITKALVEFPPKFAGRAPVNPEARKKLFGKPGSRTWKGVQGLAEDVRYYGQWMRYKAEKRIGHLYPKVQLPEEKGGGEATVIAWLWARTVKCPNPACDAQMPLVRSFWLSKKKGKQAWVEPSIDRSQHPPRVVFNVRGGIGKPVEGTVNRRGARCLCCDTPVPFKIVRSKGRAGEMRPKLMAIVAEGNHGRFYCSPNKKHLEAAKSAKPEWIPDADLPQNPRDFKTPNYGMKTFGDLFSPRQLVALTTFSDLVSEAREKVLEDARQSDWPDDGISLDKGGTGATAYADVHSGREIVMSTFARQALPMVWDYTEANPFSSSSGNFSLGVEQAAKMLTRCGAGTKGVVMQADAITGPSPAIVQSGVILTDPPYYDNIGYADLSDFFYVWLRRSLKSIMPSLFSTMLVPKSSELVATPYRFSGDKEAARIFFENGFSAAVKNLTALQLQGFPFTLFYAFKQSELEANQMASTGWETMLTGLIDQRLAVVGTWPVRTELVTSLKKSVAALASSIVIVCRRRSLPTPIGTRADFLRFLRKDLSEALRLLQRGNIAPVDLAQAVIGPGMEIFSRFSKIIEADGSSMSVRTALGLINRVIDEYHSEQESEFDPDTRWALTWFEQHSMDEGFFGDAEILSKAKNTSVDGLVRSGILQSKAGEVRLLRRDEYSEDWDPTTDTRLPVWELTQRLIHALDTNGESGAAEIVQKVGGMAEQARDLAYRLYGICERKKWAKEALAYNSLVIAWPEIIKLARRKHREGQTGLFE